MVSKTMQDAINDQINKEMQSSYLYLSMAAYFESINFDGFSHWMEMQSKEEWDHAMKLYEFLHDRGGKVVLGVIEKPASDFKSPIDTFTMVLEHEKKVTASINALYELALKEKDYPAQVMLQWFITEQVEEEKSAEEIVTQLKMVGDAPAAILMLDKQLGSRS